MEVATIASPRDFSLHADRGWQSAGWSVISGQIVDITCRGEYAVDTEPKPWISEPQGITIDYHRGRPLGEIVAMFVSSDGTFASRRIPVGTGTRVIVPADGELWLQINDSESSRENNSGTADVQIRIAE